MNTKFTKESLTAWISELIDAAKADSHIDIAYFEPTADEPVCLIAGWHKMFDNNDQADIFCMSTSRPGYIMSIKIAPNGATSFDATEPVIIGGDVDGACFPLEWDDKFEPSAADFFAHEWESYLEAYKEEL